MQAIPRAERCQQSEVKPASNTTKEEQIGITGTHCYQKKTKKKKSINTTTTIAKYIKQTRLMNYNNEMDGWQY